MSQPVPAVGRSRVEPERARAARRPAGAGCSAARRRSPPPPPASASPRTAVAAAPGRTRPPGPRPGAPRPAAWRTASSGGSCPAESRSAPRTCPARTAPGWRPAAQPGPRALRYDPGRSGAARRSQRQRGVDPDRPRVVLLTARQVGEPGLVGGRAHGSSSRTVATHRASAGCTTSSAAARRSSAQAAARGPAPGRPRGQHRAGAGGGQHTLGPADGLLGQRGDRQPPVGRPGPQPLAELVQPAADTAQPDQISLGRVRVDQHRPGRHGQEGGRPGDTASR